MMLPGFICISSKTVDPSFIHELRAMPSAICLFFRYSPHPLYLGSLLFSLDPALPGCGGRPGRFSRLGSSGSRSDDFHKPCPGVLPVSVLGPEAPRIDHQDPFVGDPPSSNTHESLSHIFRQGRGAEHIESELDGCGDLVHVLPAWA